MLLGEINDAFGAIEDGNETDSLLSVEEWLVGGPLIESLLAIVLAVGINAVVGCGLLSASIASASPSASSVTLTVIGDVAPLTRGDGLEGGFRDTSGGFTT